MMNAAFKTNPAGRAKTTLISILQKAELEYRETEEMFEMLGWHHLPAELKAEIEEDVRGYTDELKGCYSTSCPFVQRRRESVDFWVNSFRDGLCTLDTALNALSVKAF